MISWSRLITRDRCLEEAENRSILIKYDGYISRQIKQVESFKKLEKKKIPEGFDYDEVLSLRIEARQKLKLRVRDVTRSGVAHLSGIAGGCFGIAAVHGTDESSWGTSFIGVSFIKRKTAQKWRFVFCTNFDMCAKEQCRNGEVIYGV